MRYVPIAMGLMLAASGASAQMEAENMQSWSPLQITDSVVKYCGIERTYIRVDRTMDGRARILQSPSVTEDQAACARRVISQAGLTLAP